MGEGWLEALIPRLATSTETETKGQIPALSRPKLDPRATMAMLAMTSGTTGLPKCKLLKRSIDDKLGADSNPPLPTHRHHVLTPLLHGQFSRAAVSLSVRQHEGGE